MPIYTYRCENCGVRFERYQKFEEQSLTWCPECNKKTLLKVYQPVGIVFKGSGFYSTDHRSPSGQQSWSSQNSEKSSETKSETKTDAKSDTKPAETPTTPAPKPENKSE
jgi:putative FmdB family regulatory protein